MKTKENKRIKIGAVSPRIRLADVSYNVKACIADAKRAADMGVRVLCFPELTLTGATCGDLFHYSPLIECAERGLLEYIEATRALDMMSFIGLPAEIDEGIYNCVAAVYKGEIIGLVPCVGNDRWFNTPELLDGKISFLGFKIDIAKSSMISLPFDKKTRVSVYDSHEDLLAPDILLCPRVSPAVMTERKTNLLVARSFSSLGKNVCVIVNAGIGESTTDEVYSAHNLIADRGKVLVEAMPFATDNLVVADVRIGKVASIDGDDCLYGLFDLSDSDEFRSNPFLPTEASEQKEACLAAFEIQSQGLAARIERSYSKSMVIGVSGGLDSTLALLVCARAADILGMDRKSIIGVTMPCFGTTKRTKSNAEKLCEALGVSFRTVDIKVSVTQHLADIGHDGVTTDVTYENAQARERTQVLMDIANMAGGLVVGTGDLSELVLGWATYNGDHMSMYAVNASVPKTMVRRIVEVYSERDRAEGGCSADILDDILATPVSPELLPPKDGEIAQCTEELVGPYELHDFFIYYTLSRNLSPREVYERAKEVFVGVYDNKTILGWLRVFVRRFISQQFKRSCLPDGPKVGNISVSPRGALSMPSDASSAIWLEELGTIEEEEK